MARGRLRHLVGDRRRVRIGCPARFAGNGLLPWLTVGLHVRIARLHFFCRRGIGEHIPADPFVCRHFITKPRILRWALVRRTASRLVSLLGRERRRRFYDSSSPGNKVLRSR
jgi:hypothetical protein